MAARASMAALITRLRDLVDDPAGAAAVFTDDQLQTRLDERRDDVRYLVLTLAPTIAPGGAVSYLDYYATADHLSIGETIGDWETDVVLYDNTFNVITPATADYLSGHWTFAANQFPPVFLTGHTYDLYAAAADVLEAWAAKMTRQFGFATQGKTFSRQQQYTMLMGQAAQYRMRGRPLIAPAFRSDSP